MSPLHVIIREDEEPGSSPTAGQQTSVCVLEAELRVRREMVSHWDSRYLASADVNYDLTNIPSI